jgi:hypothetical protein
MSFGFYLRLLLTGYNYLRISLVKSFVLSPEPIEEPNQYPYTSPKVRKKNPLNVVINPFCTSVNASQLRKSVNIAVAKPIAINKVT